LAVVYLPSSDIRIAHEYHEEVEGIIKLQQKKLLADVSELAINSAHGLAFHRGLGTPLFPSSSTPLSNYLNEGSIAEFASDAYAKSNISVVANGTSQAELSKVVGEFFTQVPSSGSSISGEASKYYGGEERIAHGSGNSMVIAFPGSSSFTAGRSYKPEIAVLAALLGGKSSIKWSPGFSLLAKAASSFPDASAATSHFAYSDAGLLAIQFNGSAQGIRGATTEAIKSLKSISEGAISKEDFTKAVALAKFTALEEGQSIDAGLVATGAGLVHGGKPFQIDEIGKSVEAVTADKLKSVSFCIKYLEFAPANVYIGCQGSVGGQGDCFGGWRPVCIAICGGDWSQGINVREAREMEGLY
jgi:ubiquinol-cytochrome c reductase core subunit 2